MQSRFRFPSLSSNALKLLAAAAMLADHAGAILFPGVIALRYFLSMFALGVVCQLVYGAAATVDRLNILLTLSGSIVLILLLHRVKQALYSRAWVQLAAAAAGFLAALVAIYYVNQACPFDYGFWGCLTAVFASVFQQKTEAPDSWKGADKNEIHVAMLAIPLLVLASDWLQMCALFALPLLLCYSGRRGKLPMKYFFYLFYPLHLAALYGISLLMA